VIFHEHIGKFDLGCVEVLSRDQKLRHATPLFLAPLRDYIANLLGEACVQSWELRLLKASGEYTTVCVGEE
jgi:hypothetical protein